MHLQVSKREIVTCIIQKNKKCSAVAIQTDQLNKVAGGPGSAAGAIGTSSTTHEAANRLTSDEAYARELDKKLERKGKTLLLLAEPAPQHFFYKYSKCKV